MFEIGPEFLILVQTSYFSSFPEPWFSTSKGKTDTIKQPQKEQMASRVGSSFPKRWQLCYSQTYHTVSLTEIIVKINIFVSEKLRHSNRLGAFFIRKMLISFLFLSKNICCGYSLEVPQRGASNEYPQHMYSSRNKKNIPLICSYATEHSIIIPLLSRYELNHIERDLQY